MTGGIPQQATDTHINNWFSVTWEGGNLKLWGKFYEIWSPFVVPKTSDVWVVKAELIMDIKSWSDFFSVIGVHVTKYIFTSLVWGVFEKSQCLCCLGGVPFSSSTAWIFPLYFQLPYLPEETCFQQAGSSVVEGTSQAVLGSSDQRKVPASLSSKKWKNPSSASRRKRTWLQAHPVIFQPFPQPTGLGHRSQITKALVLRPFYTKHPSLFLPFYTSQEHMGKGIVKSGTFLSLHLGSSLP